MASFGNGYGSECHLLRYLGRHRVVLDEAVCAATGATAVRWLDFPFSRSWTGGKNWPDSEWLGLDFLPADSAVVGDWRARWPHGSGIMNWDAVGEVEVNGAWDWLLVEAKGHLREITSSCTAKSPDSINRIGRTLDETKATLGAPPDADWLNGYYQYANRLAVLHHLDRHGIGAQLLFLYFCGDIRRDSFVCPADEAEWHPALVAQYAHLGLAPDYPFVGRVHNLFLPVWIGPEESG